MIVNIIDLLEFAGGETENIRIAQGKYKLPENIVDGYKLLKKEITIKEFKKMVVTIADPMKRAKAMDDIKRFGKGTGFRIDKMSV